MFDILLHLMIYCWYPVLWIRIVVLQHYDSDHEIKKAELNPKVITFGK
jgi:hypothetical protein